MTYTLSDKIIVEHNFEDAGYDDMSNIYIIYGLCELTDAGPQILYIGRSFTSINSEVKIYLNEIIESFKDTIWFTYDNLVDTSFNLGQWVWVDTKYNGRKKLQLYLLNSNGTFKKDSDGNKITIGDEFTVDFIHTQPLETINNVLTITNSIGTSLPYPLISGIYYSVDRYEVETPELYKIYSKLTPTIPPKYNFAQILCDDYNEYIYSAQIDIIYNNDNEYSVVKTCKFSKDKNVLLLYKGATDTGVAALENINYVKITNQGGSTVANRYEFELCKIDNHSRFFLKWFDRLGGIQMQPFCKNSTHTTNYNYTHKIDVYDETDVISIKPNDKLQLNSGWINDDVLPCYESIFVSPFVALYDTVTNKHYKVNIDNKEFIYKTFKNQGRQMYNLQLDVTLANKENIIY